MRGKRTILCVDDDPGVLEIVQLFLSCEGFEVVTATDGSEALLQVHEHLPDLIITDYLMPGITGVELCKKLRSRRQTRPIPIILHTGSAPPPAASRLYDLLISKPADLDALVREIRTLLTAAQRRSHVQTRAHKKRRTALARSGGARRQQGRASRIVTGR